MNGHCETVSSVGEGDRVRVEKHKKRNMTKKKQKRHESGGGGRWVSEEMSIDVFRCFQVAGR